MRLRTLALALAAGVSAFVLVAVAVTELASSRIEFSLFLGLPAGLVAGAVTTALVAVGLGRSPASRRFALAAAAFGVAFPLSLVAIAFLVGSGILTAMAVAVVVGTAAAVGTYVRARNTETAPEEPERAGG
ncbi:hypothetical protein [Halorientalis litorea]|jgi:hypothetical protein|uniref:hypothetical protein n=1 Tax=Halorientalis litorea TaxID=2931977 RepID=UPI001FF354C0|nr:hypothetical protein [Halorientalis litorea]